MLFPRARPWPKPSGGRAGSCSPLLLGFFATLNLLPPDAFIARKNPDRFAATGQLDVRYLTWLSDDATPVLAETA